MQFRYCKCGKKKRRKRAYNYNGNMVAFFGDSLGFPFTVLLRLRCYARSAARILVEAEIRRCCVITSKSSMYHVPALQRWASGVSEEREVLNRTVGDKGAN